MLQVPLAGQSVAALAEPEAPKSQELVIETDERDEQAASDEAARAVQALMGGLDEDTSQFGFESSNDNLAMPSSLAHPEPSGVLEPTATPTSPSTALMDPVALQVRRRGKECVCGGVGGVCGVHLFILAEFIQVTSRNYTF